MDYQSYADYYFYDINLDELGLRLDIYRSGVQNRKNAQGKVESKRFFDLIDSIYLESTEEIATTIKRLRDMGYLSLTNLENKSFDNIICNKPFNDLKLLKLKKKYKVLKKVYEEKVVDGMCHLVTYLVVINMLSGTQKIMPMGSLGLTSEEKIANLQINGYQHISHSFLMNYLDDLNNKPLELKLTNFKDLRF